MGLEYGEIKSTINTLSSPWTDAHVLCCFNSRMDEFTMRSPKW